MLQALSSGRSLVVQNHPRWKRLNKRGRCSQDLESMRSLVRSLRVKSRLRVLLNLASRDLPRLLVLLLLFHKRGLIPLSVEASSEPKAALIRVVSRLDRAQQLRWLILDTEASAPWVRRLRISTFLRRKKSSNLDQAHTIILRPKPRSKLVRGPNVCSFSDPP